VYVNDSGGNALTDAMINITDINAARRVNYNTTSGYTPVFILTDYIANYTTNITVNNHSILASKPGYINVTKSINATSSATYNITLQPNNAPVVTTPIILPDPAYITTTQLNCSALITDYESSAFYYNFYWYNGSSLYNYTNYSVSNNTNFTMNLSTNFRKGETWNCTVNAWDGYNLSSNASDALTISNTAPVIASSRISPSPSATDSQDLLGYCNATDADSDTITYSWQWWNNSVLYSSGNENNGIPFWCYQENANTNTDCGGLSTGTYLISGSLINSANMYDGNWGTFGSALSGILYTNYTKPSTALNTSLWQSKTKTTLNNSIPQGCFDQDPLQLRVDVDGDTKFDSGYCYNGTGWQRLFNYSGVGSDALYEEAMWWNMSNYTYHTQGSEINVANISNSLTNLGDNWTLTCLGNDSTLTTAYMNSSATYIQNALDLFTNGTQIHFSNSNPSENTNITINATIFNTGSQSASNLIVQFYDGNPQNGGVQIGSNVTINLSANTNVTVNMTWITSQGSHAIFMLIDPPYGSGNFAENDETNNLANNTITISIWQIYYGLINTMIMLPIGNNLSLFNWTEQNTQGNIFVSDYDTTNSVSFTALQAIGRNTTNSSNANTQNDFENIDSLLNISGSNYSDNINSTFTSSGNPKQTQTWLVYNANIANVPYVNSTNTASFQTGLLWDTADSSNDYFDTADKEDVVFVTRINMTKAGQYGTYDYEIKVPANLKTYKGTTNAVTFYYEIQ
jgi:hypothetical protein